MSQSMTSDKKCQEIISHIQDEWNSAPIKDSLAYRINEAAELGCLEVAPYALDLLKSKDAFVRTQALRALGELKAVEHRQAFLQILDHDPDEDVKMVAWWN
jgi:HEAT repeat protein